MAPPKLGLLSYIVNDFDIEGRDVIFVPVGLNYDRVLEDRILISSDDAPDGKPRFRVSPLRSLGFFARLMWLRITGRLYRFGYACVGFGAPLSLKEFLASAPKDNSVEALGQSLTERIGLVIPVLPVSLISQVLLDASGPISTIDVKVSAERELARLHDLGAHSYVPRSDLDYAVSVGLRMLTLRRIIAETGTGFEIVPGEERVLRYYANALAHH